MAAAQADVGVVFVPCIAVGSFDPGVGGGSLQLPATMQAGAGLHDRHVAFDDFDFAAYRRAFEFMIAGNRRGVLEMKSGQKEAALRVFGKGRRFEMNIVKSARKCKALGKLLAVF